MGQRELAKSELTYELFYQFYSSFMDGTAIEIYDQSKFSCWPLCKFFLSCIGHATLVDKTMDLFINVTPFRVFHSNKKKPHRSIYRTDFSKGVKFHWIPLQTHKLLPNFTKKMYARAGEMLACNLRVPYFCEFSTGFL